MCVLRGVAPYKQADLISEDVASLLICVIYGEKVDLLFAVTVINDRVDRLGDPAGSQNRRPSDLRLS
jgi:hypothetical protein